MSTGAIGFVFEDLVGKTLAALVEPAAKKGLAIKIRTEQEIRDTFN